MSKNAMPSHCLYLAILIVILINSPINCLQRRIFDPDNPPTPSGSQSEPINSQDQTPDSAHESSAGSSSDPSEALDPSIEPSTSYPAPTELKFIRINDTAAVIRWDIADSAVKHLQFFKIQYKYIKRNVKNARWVTENREIPPTTKAYQINSLKPGTYKFVVVAVYDTDDNVPSTPEKFRLKARTSIKQDEWPTQEAPKLTWSEACADYIRFKWSYQHRDRDFEDLGFLVYYRSAQSISEFTIYNTLDENVELGELDPETPYEAKIVAYNKHTVSNFSELLQFKTKPKPATTSSGSAATDTTVRPPYPTMGDDNEGKVGTNSTGEPTRRPNSSSTMNSIPVTTLTDPTVIKITTPKPTATTTIDSSLPVNNSTSSNIYHRLSSILDLIQGAKDDANLIVKIFIIVLVPVLFIVFVFICFISSFHNRKDLDKPAAPSPIQFDIEINGYFKNSFPGVEKEYSLATTHNGHNGFINNHPHINDFA